MTSHQEVRLLTPSQLAEVEEERSHLEEEEEQASLKRKRRYYSTYGPNVLPWFPLLLCNIAYHSWFPTLYVVTLVLLMARCLFHGWMRTLKSYEWSQNFPAPSKVCPLHQFAALVR